MATEKYEKNKATEDNKDAAVQPEPETLNTTDPQEHMKGPLSSLMQGTKESFEDNGSEEEVEKAKE
jgi:hypothetical protein